MGPAGNDPRRVVLVGVAVIVAAAIGVAHQAALRDLRRLERSYLASRKVTACTIARLDPYASEEELMRLDETLDRLIADATVKAVAVRDDFSRIEVSPVPQAGRARRELQRSLDAQVRLYHAMAADPEGSRPQLEALGRANNRAERAFKDLRSTLFVAAPDGWSSRFDCPRALLEAGD